MAYVCLVFTLFVALIGPLHTHNGSTNPDPACLLCHAADRAVIVPAAIEAGKPLNQLPAVILAPRQDDTVAEDSRTRKNPRAPPVFV